MSKSEKLLQQVKDGYNLIAVHFDQTRNAPWDEFKLFKEYIKEGQKILDLGCGNGRWYQYITEDLKLKIDYYGLDNSEKLISICQKKYPGIADRFKIGEMFDLSYEDNQFDVAISIAAFHHLPTKDLRLKTLLEINRVLKSGGYLLMTNWHLWHRPFWKYFFNHFSQKVSWKDFFFPWKSAAGQAQCQRYYHAFTKGELKRLFKKAGFKTEKIFLHQNSLKKEYRRGIDVVAVVKKS